MKDLILTVEIVIKRPDDRGPLTAETALQGIEMALGQWFGSRLKSVIGTETE